MEQITTIIAKEGWITILEAAALTGYARDYIRLMILRGGRIEAQKIGTGLWLVNKQSLLDHQRNARPGRPKKKAKTAGNRQSPIETIGLDGKPKSKRKNK